MNQICISPQFIEKYHFSSISTSHLSIDDLEVECWNHTHIQFSVIFAIPSLIVWGFGIPVFAWIILARNNDYLDTIEIREKYGFLYNGYKKSFYYWETVNMFRKIAIIFISVFLRAAGVITQALVVFLLLIFFLILNIKLLPFSFKSLNDMEILSLATSMITVY
jgi:hypothetical protein